MRRRNTSHAIITIAMQRLIIQRLLIAVDPFGQQKSRQGWHRLTTLFTRNSLKIDDNLDRVEEKCFASSTNLPASFYN